MSGMKCHSCPKVNRLVSTYLQEYLRHFQIVGDPLQYLDTSLNGKKSKLWEIRSQTWCFISTLKVQRLDGSGFEKISSLRYSPSPQDNWAELIGVALLIPIDDDLDRLDCFIFLGLIQKLPHIFKSNTVIVLIPNDM